MDSGPVIHLRLPSSTLEALDKRAGDELRSRANMVAALVRQALAEPADTNEKKEN